MTARGGMQRQRREGKLRVGEQRMNTVLNGRNICSRTTIVPAFQDWAANVKTVTDVVRGFSRPGYFSPRRISKASTVGSCPRKAL